MNIPKLLKKLPSYNKINYTINNLIESVEYLYESGSGGGGIVYQAGQGIEISGSTISLNASGETYLKDTIYFTTGSQNPNIRLGTSDVDGYLNSVDLHTYSYGKVEIDIPEVFHLVNTAKNGSGYISIGGSNIKTIIIGGTDYDFVNIKTIGSGYVNIGSSDISSVNLYGSVINLSGSVYLNDSILTPVNLQPNGYLHLGGSQTSGIYIGTATTGNITIGYSGNVYIASGGTVTIGSNILITGGGISLMGTTFIATGGQYVNLGGAITISGSSISSIYGGNLSDLTLGNGNGTGTLNFKNFYIGNTSGYITIEGSTIMLGGSYSGIAYGKSIYINSQTLNLAGYNITLFGSYASYGQQLKISGSKIYITDGTTNYVFSGGTFVVES